MTCEKQDHEEAGACILGILGKPNGGKMAPAELSDDDISTV